MAYKSLAHAVSDLEKHGHLIRIREEVDPYLEMAEIHRRVFDAKGPALLFERVKGSPFQAISNLYGTFERTEFLFRHTLKKVQKVIALKGDPTLALKEPMHYAPAALTALSGLPRRSRLKLPSTYAETTIDQLPQIVSWPRDGGPFILLPGVLSFAPGDKNIMRSNLGMYRIQLGGNSYRQNEEIGMHYQLHRGIGVHHTLYNKSDEDFRVSIFVGGPPSYAFSAIMPFPEGLSELTFAGMLNGRRYRYGWRDGYCISADADFVITGRIVKDVKKPEGPFGDHLGYYSLQHDFPVVEVYKVYHRKDAIWHFTVVGRPPQEDSSFGYLIHKLVEPLTTTEFPGLKEVNAVDAAGVHPLLLAIGSERYMPFRERKPEEILTIANHLLGKGQTSLAKFLIIAAAGDDPDLNTHDIANFFRHVLERIDWRRDLHFQTKTTIDTLDYSGSGWNAGSKVVIACCGEKKRKLGSTPPDLQYLSNINKITSPFPGVLIFEGAKFNNYESTKNEMEDLCTQLEEINLDYWPLIVLADDAEFTAATLNNFLWVTFTRANPSHDIYGVRAEIQFKHWGCSGPLIIDARTKSHHAPILKTDPEITKRVDDFMKDHPALGQFA